MSDLKRGVAWWRSLDRAERDRLFREADAELGCLPTPYDVWRLKQARETGCEATNEGQTGRVRLNRVRLVFWI